MVALTNDAAKRLAKQVEYLVDELDAKWGHLLDFAEAAEKLASLVAKQTVLAVDDPYVYAGLVERAARIVALKAEIEARMARLVAEAHGLKRYVDGRLG